MTEYQTLINKFKFIDPKSIKNNIFQDLEIDGFCFNVHDPDTISVLFTHNEEIIKYNLRLSGIDAPELHSKNANERELCIKGTDYLKSLILNKIIKIKTSKPDKYGRMLVNIYDYDVSQCFNDLLIKMGYVRPYFGEKKLAWDLENSELLTNIEIVPDVI